MAQLKDLIVSGATRLIGNAFVNNLQITTINAPTSAGGSTYGTGTNGQILKSNGSSIYWDSVATINSGTANQVAYYSNASTIASKAPEWKAWVAGTTAGPQAKIQIGNAEYTSAAIPSASASASGIVNTTTQYFKGRKGFGHISRYGRNDTGEATQYIEDTFLYNNAGIQVGEHWYDAGNATNITKGQFYWREFSPNSTANTSTTGFYETYTLPNVTSDLSENKTYNILTNKSAVTIGQGGTGETTAAGAWTALGGGSVGKLNIDGSSSTKYLRGDGTWQTIAITDTKLRTYRSSTNVELPIAGINTGNATAAYATISSGSYKDIYGAIPETTTNVATINPSTGQITIPGGINVTNITTPTDKTYGIGNVSSYFKNIYSTAYYIKDFYNAAGTLRSGIFQEGNILKLTERDSSNTFVTRVAQADLQNRKIDVYYKAKFNKGFNNLFTGGTAIDGAASNGTYYPLRWYFDANFVPIDGDIVTIKIPGLNNNDYGIFLSLDNQTTYYPISANSTSRLNSQFPIDNYISLVFEVNGSTGSVFPIEGAASRSTITGGCWRVINFYDSNTYPSAYCNTAGGTQAKSATCTNYYLQANSYLHVLIVNSNTYSGKLTFNPNSKGAKDIYINGTISSSTNKTLPAGAYIAFYDGSVWHFRTDGLIPGATANIAATAATSNTNYYIIGASAAGVQTPYIATPNGSGINNTSGIYFQGSTGVLFGAAWNDYAEYRQKKNIEDIPYGYVVIENGDDSVSLSTKRLQPCGQIVSDTFGFILGPEENGLPVALCGRVLAYPYEDRNSFEIGDAVCTAPDGKVSKMTREEIREWPDRIIGYVSSIPQYEIWEQKNIAVNGRIWIKVK